MLKWGKIRRGLSCILIDCQDYSFDLYTEQTGIAQILCTCTLQPLRSYLSWVTKYPNLRFIMPSAVSSQWYLDMGLITSFPPSSYFHAIHNQNLLITFPSHWCYTEWLESKHTQTVLVITSSVWAFRLWKNHSIVAFHSAETAASHDMFTL
jgi:hypothetical protein